MTTNGHILNLATTTVPVMDRRQQLRRSELFRATCSCGVAHGANLTRDEAHRAHVAHFDAMNEQEQRSRENTP